MESRARVLLTIYWPWSTVWYLVVIVTLYFYISGSISIPAGTYFCNTSKLWSPKILIFHFCHFACVLESQALVCKILISHFGTLYRHFARVLVSQVSFGLFWYPLAPCTFFGNDHQIQLPSEEGWGQIAGKEERREQWLKRYLVSGTLCPIYQFAKNRGKRGTVSWALFSERYPLPYLSSRREKGKKGTVAHSLFVL